MQHVANMNNKSLICSGYSVPNSAMSADDLEWAMKSSVISQNKSGDWYHTQITERDRQYRRNYWKPDTGRREDNIAGYRN